MQIIFYFSVYNNYVASYCMAMIMIRAADVTFGVKMLMLCLH